MSYHHVEKDVEAAEKQKSQALIQFCKTLVRDKLFRNAFAKIVTDAGNASATNWTDWKRVINQLIATPTTKHKMRSRYQRNLEMLDEIIQDQRFPSPVDFPKLLEAISICAVAISIINSDYGGHIPKLSFHRFVCDSVGNSVLSKWTSDYEISQFNDNDHEIDITDDHLDHVQLIEVKNGNRLTFKQMAKYYFISTICDWYQHAKPVLATRGNERYLRSKAKEIIDKVRDDGDPLSFNENDFSYIALDHRIT